MRIRVGPNHAKEFEVVTGFKQRGVLSHILKVIHVAEVATKQKRMRIRVHLSHSEEFEVVTLSN